jgi:DNA-binding MarR family transcriptional regulator
MVLAGTVHIAMADVIHSKSEPTGLRREPAGAAATEGSDTATTELIELLFFAYRDFISDADAILETFGFGRAHHRVVYFVNRTPGMTVAELLDILKITKQSLGRVLRELIDAGFIEQRTGEADRRQRLLFATPRGIALAAQLTAPQTRRIARATEGLTLDDVTATRQFLRHMINEADRAQVGRGGTRR